MKITRLPKDPGPAAWNALLPTPKPAKVLSGDMAADWLIIGGGFAGLAAAQRLKQLHPEARIVLLEARRIGEGPAGRNSGFMIDLPHDLSSADYGGAVESDRAQTKANRAAIDFAASMAVDYGLNKEAFDIPGKVNAAATQKGHQHNLDFARHLQEIGESCDFLDADQMQEMTGTGYYQSGLFTPGAAVIQPAMFVRGVAEGLNTAGVRVFENSAVVELTRNGVWQARTPKGSVTAPKVIMAVNGHANSFGYFQGQLLHVLTYGSMTRALSAEECARLGGQARWGLTPADPMGTTVRRISGVGGDRIIVRNRFTCDPSMEVGPGRIASVARSHDRAFAARFPMLRDVEMQYRWGGRLCLSWNSVPALGEVDKGLFSACCQNGLGVAKGTLNGMLMAELASGHHSSLLEAELQQAAPAHLPPRPLTQIGANARMKWAEWKAGREM